ncbi:MAG: hypothetical protein ACE5I7_05135 [Candidatus Binatia bacterium]
MNVTVRKCQRRWLRVPHGLLAMLLIAGGAHAQVVGDANCDGALKTDDVIALIRTIFARPGADCGSADVDGDGRVDGSDIVALVRILYAPPPAGPTVAFIGLAGADGTPLSPLGEIAGAPVFFRTAGSGFNLVVEGARGPSGAPPGVETFNTARTDPLRRPDLQIESSNALGDGSPAVCDGGVPAVDPPDFGPAQGVANALNDLACNFTVATSPRFTCTQDVFGANTFVAGGTEVQFCLRVSRTLEFPIGETVLSVRLRDTGGNLGAVQRLILRVGRGPVPATFTPQPAATPVPPTSTAPSLKTPTPTQAATKRPPSTPTRTPLTPRGTATATVTCTPTSTPTRGASPTVTAGVGPMITFLGLTRSDDTLIPQSGTTAEGLPIYTHPTGAAFSLVVEGKPGASGAPVGRSAYQPVQCSAGGAARQVQFQADASSFPDLQVEVSRPLGNGSARVCDSGGPMAGGVPAIDPPSFVPTQANIDAVNDLSCRFLDGVGAPCARRRSEGCVLFPSGEFGFANSTSTTEFCGFITSVLQFPRGDTVVTARLRDVDGNVGMPVRLVVRVGAAATPTATMALTETPVSPTATVTPTAVSPPTPSPTLPAASGPLVTYLGLTRSDDTLIPQSGTTPEGVPIYPHPTGLGFSIIVEGAPGASGVPVGPSAYGPAQCVASGAATMAREPGGGLRSQVESLSFPDLQVEVSRALGNGSPAVCDDSGPAAGGVPAIEPPSFLPAQDTVDAVNDLGCRFVDGQGKACGRSDMEACVLFPTGQFGFVDPRSTIQFCGLMTSVLRFPTGDTVVTVRLRDENGNPGPPAQLVVRVGRPPQTATLVPSPTATTAASHTPTPTRPPTPTPTPNVSGPVVSFFGLTRADDTLVPQTGSTPDGLPIYSRRAGSAFSLVIEGRPGPSGVSVGRVVQQTDLASLPDLQVEVSRPLGDGSPEVCDRQGSNPGGVPAIVPPSFEPSQANINAVNDLGCRFLNGAGVPGPRTKGDDPCVLFPSGDFGFVDPTSTAQFCALIDPVLEFPQGDTLVTARLRDRDGNPGVPRQLVVRVEP